MEHQKNFERIPNYPELEDKIIVTRGKDGCIFRNEIFPVKEVSVKDVSGAGDTFMAGLVVDYIKTKGYYNALLGKWHLGRSHIKPSGVDYHFGIHHWQGNHNEN